MTMTIDPIKLIDAQTRPLGLDPKQLRTPSVATPDASRATNFKDTLKEAVTEVQRLQSEADNTIKQLVSGEIKDVTEAMVAVEKADVSFQTMMSVRNKMVQAYEEIMRMQV